MMLVIKFSGHYIRVYGKLRVLAIKIPKTLKGFRAWGLSFQPHTTLVSIAGGTTLCKPSLDDVDLVSRLDSAAWGSGV